MDRIIVCMEGEKRMEGFGGKAGRKGTIRKS
jgi:hypothetical protein